jgi:itaconyl-CoA hydratase
MPVHFDHNYAAQTEFGKPLVDSTFTLALVTGQSVTDISQNVFANLGWDESRSRPNVGIVTVETTGYNQDGRTVITFKRTIMVYRRGQAPKITRITPGGDG